MNNDFKRSFMHPTRRKLADMVITGEYDDAKQVSFANSENVDTKRVVGETWVDADGNHWEQKEFGRMKTSAISETMSDVRNYLEKLGECNASDCNTYKYSAADKKLISKTGYCATCLAKRELIIKVDGLWDEYEKYRMYSNMIDYAIDVIANLKQAYSDVKQEYTYVNDNGITETWTLERNADDLRAEIADDISNIEKELSEIVEKRVEVWEKLKDKNYELIPTLNI